MPAPNITDRHPKESNNKVKGTPADKAPKMPRLSAKPVIMAKRFGINHWVDSFNMETQATPIDHPIISLPKLAIWIVGDKTKMKVPKLVKRVPAVSNFLGPQ